MPGIYKFFYLEGFAPLCPLGFPAGIALRPTTFSRFATTAETICRCLARLTSTDKFKAPNRSSSFNGFIYAFVVRFDILKNKLTDRIFVKRQKPAGEEYPVEHLKRAEIMLATVL